MPRDLEELRNLRPGWDGYDGVPPTDAAMATARLLHYTPMSSGGIMIELHANGATVEIDIGADGRVVGVEVTPGDR